MNETSEGGAAFSISIGLAFIGGYADASSYLLARTFTGHLTGNCVLAAVSAASRDLYLTLDRLLAVIVFLGGILFSLILNRFAPGPVTAIFASDCNVHRGSTLSECFSVLK
jgi:uncharacterized membrane protein YoaK (UPF0700 family)